MMHFTHETQRLLAGFLLFFLLIALLAGFWAVVGPATLLEREDNRRRVEAEAGILRGTIHDRDGEVLAYSTSNDAGIAERRYAHPALYGALGYFSQRYGTAGAEAAFDLYLSGDDRDYDTLSAYWEEVVLHRPRQGTDVRLSFDLQVQQAIVTAMGNDQGAVVVLSVPDGEIIALVSRPTYDPNTLDQRWDTLVNDPAQPFFNRALQGDYQPGGILQTALIAAAISHDIPLATLHNEGTTPMEIGGVTVNCTAPPPFATITLQQAYVYGCPEPFLDLAQRLGPERLGTFVTRFRAPSVTFPALPGPPLPTSEARNATPTPVPTLSAADALGQGEVTMTPLNLATVAAGILNGGNASAPHLLLATQPPGNPAWDPVEQVRPTIPITTAETAAQLRDLMLESVALGNAQSARREGLGIGGHSALAYSGDTTLAWFFGFVQTDTRRGYAVAVILEDTTSAEIAATLGGRALEAAVHAESDSEAE